MKQYSTKKDEKFFVGHFAGPRKKLTKKQKTLREWHLHPKTRKLFVNVLLGGEKGLMKAVVDGVQMYFYPDKEGSLFVNVDWMIERDFLTQADNTKLQELKKNVFESNKELLKMDKQINKVKKDVQKDDKKKAKKDIKKLLKMDKKFDEELEECHHMKKKKK